MTKKILVIGATGLLGAPVARRLQKDGFVVRAMSRDSRRAQQLLGDGFDCVDGNTDDVASLKAAMDGCQLVHVNLNGGPDLEHEPRAMKNIVAAARTKGIERIGLISGCTVFEKNTWNPIMRSKLEVETTLKASKIPYTIFRCTMFMELLPRMVRGNKATLMGKPASPYNYIAAQDYARMASAAYQKDEAANKSVVIHGPESITSEKAMQTYCATKAPGAQVKNMPLWLMSIIGWLSRNPFLKFAVCLYGYFEKVPQMGDPTEANELLGAPTLTVAAWSRTAPEPGVS